MRHSTDEGSTVKSRLFTIISLGSFLLCIATAALWLRSYCVYDAFNWERPGSQLQSRFSMVVSRHGRLSYLGEDRSLCGWPPNRGYFEDVNGIHGLVTAASLITSQRQQELHAGIFDLYRSTSQIGFAIPDAVLIFLASICPGI
jgi:hypothetical protein